MGNKFGNLIPRFTRRNRPTPTRNHKYKFNSDTLDSIQMELNDRNADLDACKTALEASQQKLETIEQFLKTNEIAQLNNLSKAYNDFKTNEFYRLRKVSRGFRKMQEGFVRMPNGLAPFRNAPL